MKQAKPRGMDEGSWRAFRKAWNATPGYAEREQLCREYGISISQAGAYVHRGVGMVRLQPHNRRAG